jgi:hypothetical protein
MSGEICGYCGKEIGPGEKFAIESYANWACLACVAAALNGRPQLPAYVASREGPTLRDRFAMAALTGILASGRDGIRTQTSPEVPLTMRAYEIADAMLERRAK